MESEPPFWIALAFASGFVALWIGIFQAIAVWGGWKRLAAVYPERALSTIGERFRMRSVQLRRGCNYNNCVSFAASPAGLRMSLIPLMNFGHPPIFLPWDELRAEESTVWRIRVVTLTAARCPEIPIKLRPKLAERLLAAAPSATRW